MSQSRSTEFLAAFNAIENHFKSRLNDPNAKFKQLTDAYSVKYGLRRNEVDSLKTFSDLRNFMAHSEYYGGQPIAEPIPDIVAAIRKLRDRIIEAPLVLKVLPHRPVCAFQIDEPVSSALSAVRLYDYSQFPVYAGDHYRGLLTTNCIARWLAARLKNDELAESEPIDVVLQFSEKSDRAIHLARDATAREAINRLTPPPSQTVVPAALIINHSGKPDQKPLAIVVAEDLPVLFRALD